MQTHLKWLLATPLAAMLTACATSAGAPPTVEELLAERDLRIAESVDRIFDYRISGWNYLDRQHLILLDGVNRKYLVTLVRQCDGLQSNEVIAHTSTINTLTTFDRFLVRDFGHIVDHCYIESLHRLEEIETA